MVRTVVEVVATVEVVAVPVVVYAVLEDHPFLFNPFPCPNGADPPYRYRRSRPVSRTVWNVVAVVMEARWRRCVVMCDMWHGIVRPGMVHVHGRPWRRSWRRWPWHRSCCRRPWRRSCCGWSWRLARRKRSVRRHGGTPVAAVVVASGRSKRRRAEYRAGDSSYCEFHDVVVHSAPSLSF